MNTSYDSYYKQILTNSRMDRIGTLLFLNAYSVPLLRIYYIVIIASTSSMCLKTVRGEV